MKINILGLALAALAALCACDGGDTQYQSDPEGCQGQSLQVEQDSYCVYEGSVIVEEGFQCPPDTPFLHEGGGLGICSGSSGDSAERIQEVIERFEAGGDNNDNNEVQPDPEYPQLGATCQEPASLLLNVEPLEPRELFIVLLREGEDVAASAQALSGHYGFGVEDVFEVIPAFSASLSQEEVQALRCYAPVRSIEQSRSDTAPPGGAQVSSFAAACSEVEGQAVSMLEVSDLGAGSVEVTHVGFEANCCASLSAMADADYQGRQLALSYSEGDSPPCDCDCIFELSYTVSGLSGGVWGVSTGELSQEVQVVIE